MGAGYTDTYIGMVTSRTKIVGAFILGMGLVLGAFWLRAYSPAAENGTGLAVATRDEATRVHINTDDQDGDGIPDWQEALQRTEPITLKAATSTYETPDTLTDQFAIQFFQDMVRAENYGAFGSNPEELADYATNAFAEKANDVLIGANDITITPDNGVVAIKNYANQMATIALDYTVPANSLSELEILKQSLDTGNPAILSELDVYVDGYSNMLTRSLATPVPDTYSKGHLDLLNVYQALRNDLVAMQASHDDPLNALIRVKRYQEDASTLAIAVLNLYQQALADQVTFTDADPASQFLP